MHDPLVAYDPLTTRQLELESEMRSQGTQRFWLAVHEAKANGRESETKYGHSILAGYVVHVAAGIVEFLKVNKVDGVAVRRASAAKYLDLIEPEVAAFIAIKG